MKKLGMVLLAVLLFAAASCSTQNASRKETKADMALPSEFYRLELQDEGFSELPLKGLAYAAATDGNPAVLDASEVSYLLEIRGSFNGTLKTKETEATAFFQDFTIWDGSLYEANISRVPKGEIIYFKAYPSGEKITYAATGDESRIYVEQFDFGSKEPGDLQDLAVLS